jgi:Tol biopolymer transport system component
VAHVRPRFSPDGSTIVFQNVERTNQDVRSVHVPTGRLAWITRDPYPDVHPCWSASGRFVYFSSYRSGGINLWKTPVGADGAALGPSRQVTTGPGQDVEAAISRDGKRLAFTILRQNADLWRLPVSPLTGEQAGPPEKVLATTREESRGAFSPDGGTIAFNSDRGGDMNIWILPPEGGARPVTRGPGGDYQPCFSPDGSRLAFFSSRAGTPGIWTVSLPTGELIRLTDGGAIRINPFFSPDGRSIAYQSDEAGRLEVWRMDADGGNPRQLTDVGVMGHFLRFTADGRHIVFRSPGRGAPATMRVPADGGAPESLPEVKGGAHMSFSPDGSRILDVVGHKTLWVSPLDGGKPAAVFEFDDPDVRIDYPVWSPDGRYVLFDRFRPQGGDVWTIEELE